MALKTGDSIYSWSKSNKGQRETSENDCGETEHVYGEFRRALRFGVRPPPVPEAGPAQEQLLF
jgi:hypothetical protein